MITLLFILGFKLNKCINYENVLFSIPTAFCLIDLNFNVIFTSNLFNSVFNKNGNINFSFVDFLRDYSALKNNSKIQTYEDKLKSVVSNNFPSYFSVKLKVHTHTSEQNNTKLDFKIAIIPMFENGLLNSILLIFENKIHKNYNFNLFENIFQLGARYKTYISDKISRSQKLENIGNMTTGIIHDLNNMFTIINMNCDIILNLSQNVSPVIRKQTEQIKKSSKLSAQLMQQILNYSKKSASRIQPIDMNVLIDDLEKMLIRVLPENIILLKELEPNINTVLVDQVHLEQIILNIVINARDAIESNGQIKISTVNTELQQPLKYQNSCLKQGKYVVLSIADTGKGIEEKVLNKIFEPFFTTKEEKGTGIGLSTVINIMNQYNGAVFVESMVGKGTTFLLYFPASTQPSVNLSSNKRIELDKLRGSEKILVIEDNTDLRNIIVYNLEQFGYSIQSVSNGLDAFSLMKQNNFKYNLIIIDIILPILNGVKLKELLDKENIKTNILFLTGYNDLILSEIGNNSQDVEYLDKPFVLNDLLLKIRTILDRKKI